MGHEKDAAHLRAQVLQLLNHDLPALAIQTSEPLVDNDRFDGPMLPAGVLAQAERETDGNAEFLAAAQEGDVDRSLAGDAIVRFQLQGFLRGAVAAGFAYKTQVQLAG